MSDAAPEDLERAFEKWLEAQKQAAERMVSTSHPGTPQDWALWSTNPYPVFGLGIPQAREQG